jgi:hypothetical protein
MTKTKGKTVKVVINKCFGGFSISKAAADYMAKKGSKRAAAEVAEYDKKNRWMKSYLKTGKWPKAVPEFERGMLEIDAKYHQKPRFHGYGYAEGMDGAYERDDPLLVEAVEKLGDAASGEMAFLRVVEIPAGVKWHIDEYDGREHIAEDHQTWS